MKFLPKMLFINIIILYWGYSQNQMLDTLKSITNIQKDEFLLITYQNPSTCIKCYIEPFELINSIDNQKGSRKFKYIALVRCDRDIELKVFARETGWKYYVYRDDGSAKEKLKASSKAIITIIPPNDCDQLNLISGQPKENFKKVRSLLEK